MLQRFLASLSSRQVGRDRFGNLYFESRRDFLGYGRKRRHVVYAKGSEPTQVPPEWHAWLHHTVEAPLPEQKRHAWMIEHRPNPTGTAQAYRPVGHDYAGGKRRETAGDYEAWTPGS